MVLLMTDGARVSSELEKLQVNMTETHTHKKGPEVIKKRLEVNKTETKWVKVLHTPSSSFL